MVELLILASASLPETPIVFVNVNTVLLTSFKIGANAFLYLSRLHTVQKAIDSLITSNSRDRGIFRKRLVVPQVQDTDINVTLCQNVFYRRRVQTATHGRISATSAG